MWTAQPVATPPASRIASAVSSHASALRLATTTCAPRAAKASAMARPMPRLPPVMIATRPVRSKSESRSSLRFTDRTLRGHPHRPTVSPVPNLDLAEAGREQPQDRDAPDCGGGEHETRVLTAGKRGDDHDVG